MSIGSRPGKRLDEGQIDVVPVVSRVEVENVRYIQPGLDHIASTLETLV
jgi:hypothetical protein